MLSLQLTKLEWVNDLCSDYWGKEFGIKLGHNTSWLQAIHFTTWQRKLMTSQDTLRHTFRASVQKNTCDRIQLSRELIVHTKLVIHVQSHVWLSFRHGDGCGVPVTGGLLSDWTFIVLFFRFFQIFRPDIAIVLLFPVEFSATVAAAETATATEAAAG